MHGVSRNFGVLLSKMKKQEIFVFSLSTSGQNLFSFLFLVQTLFWGLFVFNFLIEVEKQFFKRFSSFSIGFLVLFSFLFVFSKIVLYENYRIE